MESKPHNTNQSESPLKRVLFYPWDKEGRPNLEYLEFLSELNQELLKRPDYVALTGYGSQFKGYANKESDFDILLIGGDGKLTTEKEITKVIQTCAQKYEKNPPDEWCLPEICSKNYFEINLDPSNSKHSNQSYGNAIWPLAYPLIGRKEEIARLRNLAHKKHIAYLNSNYPECAKRNVEEAIKEVVRREFGVDFRVSTVDLKDPKKVIFDKDTSHRKGTFEKLIERGWSEKELKEIVVAREKLWRKRIMDLVNATGEFAQTPSS